MTTLHFEPLVWQVRGYSEGGSYGDPYDAVGTLYISGKLASLTGLNSCAGDLSPQQMYEFFQWLEIRGVETLYTTRHGKDKMYDVSKMLDRLEARHGV